MRTLLLSIILSVGHAESDVFYEYGGAPGTQ